MTNQQSLKPGPGKTCVESRNSFNSTGILKSNKNNEEELSSSVTITIDQKENPKSSEKPHLNIHGWRRFGGICFSLASCMTWSLMALVGKVLKQYHPVTITFWRYMGSTTPCLLIIVWYLYWKRKPILKPIFGTKESDSNHERRSNIIGMLVRGASGVIVTMCRFAALKYISLPDVSAITSSKTAIVYVFAFFILHEKCSIIAIISAFLAICGVGILSRPPLLTGQTSFNEDSVTGFGFALGAMVCSALSIVMTRKLRNINFAVLIVGFGLIGIFTSGLLALSLDVVILPQNFHDAKLILLLGSLAFVSQILSILAIKYEEAGIISIVKFSQILFSFMWQILLLDLYPDLFSIVGVSVIFIGLVLTGVRKWVNTLSESDRLRKKLAFLLI